jgi:hypothetical protein
MILCFTINISTNISEIDAIVLGGGDILIDETDNVILKALTTFEKPV